MDDIKISIIMPAYQVEKTIQKAVESLQNQTLSEWELIIVNDCSTDGTKMLCERLCQIDARIKLINLDTNMGLAYARNCGIQQAVGRYITFVDSDDWIEPDTLSASWASVLKYDADIAVWGMIQDLQIEQNQPIYTSVTITYKDKLFDTQNTVLKSIALLDYAKIFPYTCNKLYKRELLGDIRFSNVLLVEDFLFNLRAFEKASRVVSIKKAYYHYVQTMANNTLSSKYNPDYFSSMCIRFASLLSLYEKYQIDSDTLNLIYNTNNKILVSTMVRLWSKNNQQTFRQKVHSIKLILNHAFCRLSSHRAIPITPKDRLYKYTLMSGSKYLSSFVTLVIYGVSRYASTIFYRFK